MRKLLLFLLLPSLLWAASGVTIKKSENFVAPSGWVDRVSKRTQMSKTFEQGAIGSGKFMTVIGLRPMHYDSAGTWKNLEVLTVLDTTSTYDISVRTGRFIVSIDTVTGAFRFLRDHNSKRGSVSFIPGFSPNSVPIEYSITENGIKSIYTLNSGNRLSWAFDYSTTLDTSDAKGKGKGRIKDSLGKIKAEVSEFTAKDATGKSVPLTATWTEDSLLVVLNATGMTYPIYVDPSVVDSVNKGTSSASLVQIQASYALSRDSVVARAANSAQFDNSTQTVVGRSGASNYRLALSFGLAEQPSGGAIASVDSVRMYLYYRGTAPASDSVIVRAAQGNFTGGQWDVFWYNDFIGWAASGVYTISAFDSLIDGSAGFKVVAAEGAGWKSALFNKAGRDSVLSKMGRDTLRVMMLAQCDIDNGSPALPATYLWDGGPTNPVPYLSIYYTSAVAPTVTTTADTLKAAAVFIGNVTATGGVNLTSRGVKLWPKGATLANDTMIATSTGSFGTGVFSIYVDSLMSDTLYLYKIFGTNPAGTNYGSTDSISTSLTGGTSTSVYIDGRRVDHVR